MPQPEFGRRLRKLRAGRGLSQRDLASGAVNQSYISLLESGARVPTLDVVAHLAKMLGVPLRDLAGDIDVDMEAGAAAPAPGPAGPAPAAFVQELLATSAIDQGDLDQAEQQLTRLFESAVAAGSPTAILTQGLDLERVLEMRGDRPARYALLGRLLPVAESSGVAEARVRIRVSLAAAARDVGRLDEAFGHIEHAQQEIDATAYRHGAEHIKLMAVHISILADSGGGAEIVRLVNGMLAMAEQLDSPGISGRAHWAASLALAAAGETDRSLELLAGARRMLANPRTSLRDWARFSRAAASTLLDVDADRERIDDYMRAARAATVAEAGPDANRLAALEVRYAIATGDPERALAMAATVDESLLMGLEGVRFLHAVGSALVRVDRAGEAVATLRRAAQLAEEISAFRRASQLWRELNDLMASQN
ncbi:helix-turn-helix transcriptional regulator [Actinoplanes sp. NPDC023714]|uniref:helix-turn-helix domain-containing protein n=1 Tax=Actinoplanes sp. NPDC023714 TaxID=3154322 RepID=UPI0033EEFA72